MNEDLLTKPINGQTLNAYDDLIKDWVLEQLRTGAVNEERVTEIVNTVLAETKDNPIELTPDQVRAIWEAIGAELGPIGGGGGISEERVREIITEMMTAAGDLTEERVQQMIDESVGAAINATY